MKSRECSLVITLCFGMMMLELAAGLQETCTALTQSTTAFLYMDCSSRKLTQVPDNLPPRTAHLDLSFNNLSSLGAHAFKDIPVVEVLNITGSNIYHLHNETFCGLSNLHELYIPGNPILYSLPPDVFHCLPYLNTLHLWTVRQTPMTFGAIANLNSLNNLAITPNVNSIPIELLSLINLKILTLAFGDIQNVTYDLMKHLPVTHLEELTFHGCNILNIENGAFANFTSLHLLNFACNNDLTLTNIIDAISTSENINVTELIVDLVGSNRGNVLGPDDTPQCRKAWNNLQKLSARGVGPIEFTNLIGTLECLKGLKSLSMSHNSILPIHPFNVSLMKEQVTKLSLLSLDVSHSFTGFDPRKQRRNSMCYGEVANYIPRNQDVFTPMLKSKENCLPHEITIGNMSNAAYTASCVNKLFIPPCLSYLDAHGYNTSFLDESCCNIISANKLKYLDLSDMKTHQSTKLLKSFPGLQDLELLNLVNSSLTSLGDDSFVNTPSLKTLLLAGNFLNQSNFPAMSHLKQLEILDLSSNSFTYIKGDFFSDNSSLKFLNLSMNYLTDASFFLNFTKLLRGLDLSNNKLISLPENITQGLDHVYKYQNITVHLGNNPYVCSCGTLQFIQWIQQTSVFIADIESVDCTSGNGKINIADVDIETLKAACGSSNVKIALVLGVMCILGLVTATVTITYCMRWTICWGYYKLKYMSRRRTEYLQHEFSTITTFKAYIIFSMNDDEVRHWVAHVLCPRVEGEWNQGPLFLPGLRDDIGGVADVDNITEGVMSSQTAIWILSPEFFEDRHCEIAAHFAFHHLGAKRNLIVMWERRIFQCEVPRQFPNLLNKKHGIPRITYSDDNYDVERVFWSQLQQIFTKITQKIN